jgi:hypothetical protein
MENRVAAADIPNLPESVEATEDGSISTATDALLKMLDAEDAESSTEEEAPLEETEDSQPETEEESVDEEEVGESDEEDYEPDDNRDEEGDDTSDVYSVKVDGKDIEVSIDELVAGYSRQSDYTRKTQELATERKQLEDAYAQMSAEIEQNNAIREQYIQATGQFIAASHGNLEQFSKIDWRALKEDDPIEYVTKRDEYREAQARIQHAHKLQQQAAVEADQERGRLMQAHVAHEHELMAEVMPEWADAEKRTALAGQVRSYAESRGYQPEEIEGLADHRSLQVLIKAMKYDALEGGDIKKKKIRNKPKLVKSGTSRTKDAADKKKRKAQVNRLKQTGSTKDAAKLLEDLI